LYSLKNIIGKIVEFFACFYLWFYAIIKLNEFGGVATMVIQIILNVLHVLISIAIMILVLSQQGKQPGMSGAIAGGAETFFGKNKARTVDAMLKRITAGLAISFLLTSVILQYLVLKAS
jgi:preprotein translocase subunit SecG